MNLPQSLAAQSAVVIMDIEGTVAPIEFVHQKMFPYIRDNVQSYLSSTWETEQTQSDIKLLVQQSNEDKTNNFTNITLITGDHTTPQEELLPQLVANVTSQMDIDRKIGALKTLQGHIWKQVCSSSSIFFQPTDPTSILRSTSIDPSNKTIKLELNPVSGVYSGVWRISSLLLLSSFLPSSCLSRLLHLEN